MKLSEIIDVFVSGDWGNDSPSVDTPHAVRCVRGADFVPICESRFSHLPVRYVSERALQKKQLKEGDIIVEKSGGSPTQSTGRVVFVSRELITSYPKIVCSNFCVAFRVKEGWDPYFVYQHWNSLYANGVFFNFEGQTSGIKNLQLDIALSSIEIEPYPMENQTIIAQHLQRLERKISLNRSLNHNLVENARHRFRPDHSSIMAEVGRAAA